MIAKAQLAVSMFKDEEGENKNAVQFGTDYFDIPGTPYECGHSGFIDFKGRYWPCAFVITKHENKETAEMMMGAVKLIVQHLGGKKIICLNDASYALDSAIKELKLLLQRCFAHVVRFPATKKGNSRHSTRGSLARYILKTMNQSHATMSKVSVCCTVLKSFT